MGGHQIQQVFRSPLLKITSGLKNSPGHDFWLKKLKNDIKITLKPTGIKLQENPIKIYYAVYNCKKNDVTLQLSKRFFNHTFINTRNLIWWKNELKSFLGHSQSSIEARQFFRTNFIKLLLSDYIVYGIFVWENLWHF